VTSSYDKRVKLWSADSGAFIDELQQNFIMKEPQPLAYQKVDSVQVYDLNFKDQLLLKTNVHPSVLTMELNPRWLFDRMDIAKLPNGGVSNRTWKVKPVLDGYNKR
jgi:hypothetical protein